MQLAPQSRQSQPQSVEQGFALVALIVAIALILLALSVAAPVVAKELRRDREVEAVHRGNQYIRAIRLYYRKFGHYPGSIEQLEKTNNIRFLRQRYLDPMTGKDDWRIIPVGQNQTQVKWFFGAPLTGVAGGGLGSAAGLASPGIGSSSPTGSGGLPGASGTSPTNTTGPASGTTPAGDPGAVGASGSTGVAGATGTTGSSGTPSGTSGLGTPGGGSFGSPFMGVGLNAPGDSIIEWNQQTAYAQWEFLYDPRLDQMIEKAKALNGGGVGSTAAGSLGQTPTTTNPGSPSTPTGTTPGSPASPGTPPTPQP